MFPSLIIKNQFGEQSNNFLLGGTNQLWANFIVDSANGNGLGIRSLKGNCLKNVFMFTSATPASGNPNPIAGLILVEFQSAFANYINGAYGFASPASGTPINISSGLSVGHVYIIVSVGTSTPANWQALGLPSTVTPAVGVAFIATSASAGTGTGVVEIPAVAGSAVDHIELVGDPNTTCKLIGGGYMIIKCVAGLALTAPADGSVVGLTFNMVPVPEELI